MFECKKYLMLLAFILYNCSYPTNSIIEELNISFNVKNVSEYGKSDGSVDLTVEGGTEPYSYEWSNGATTEDITNLIAGIYIVTVSDAGNLTKRDTINVGQPPNPLNNRDYHHHIPPSYDGNESVPLLIALHHYGYNGIAFEDYTNFSTLSDRENFIVVYPNATGDPSEWNVGIGYTPSTKQVNDVAFISALIDTFIANYNIDSSRIYVTGFSNGAIMSHLLGAELHSKISAIAAVAAQATYPILSKFPSEANISVMHFHMLDDRSLSYNGGTINGVSYPPVEYMIDSWINVNNCDSVPTILLDNGEILARRWSSNNHSAEVVLYKINSGGHNWLYTPITMTEIIWEFLSGH